MLTWVAHDTSHLCWQSNGASEQELVNTISPHNFRHVVRNFMRCRVLIRINRYHRSRALLKLYTVHFACNATHTSNERWPKTNFCVDSRSSCAFTVSRKTGSEATQPQCFNRPPQEGLEKRPSEPLGGSYRDTCKVSRF